MSCAPRITLATSLLLAISAVSFGAMPMTGSMPTTGSTIRLPMRLPQASSQSGPATDPSDLQQYAVSTRFDRIGRIIAPVMINGRGPFRFMLDTGATHTVLAESTLAKLDRTTDPDTHVPVSGVTGSELTGTVHIDSLDAGDLHFKDMDLPVLKGAVLDGIDGILGMDGFDGMKWSADFMRDRFTLSHSLAEPAGFSYSVIPVEFVSERLLMIDARVGHVPVKAIIDTGGLRTIGNQALLTALVNGHQGLAHTFETTVVDATEMSQPGTMGRVPLFKLGGATIENLEVTFGDFEIFRDWDLSKEPALLIGMDVLGTLANLSVDYRRKEVELLPRPLQRPAGERQWHSLTFR
jgi:predicted aspartyl protease